MSKRSLSLQWKLPLLMTAFLVGGLAVMLGLTYRSLTVRTETAVRERLTHAARALAGILRTDLEGRDADLEELARDPALATALRADQSTTDPTSIEDARRVIARALSPDDSTVAIELWDSRGQVLTSAGRGAPAGERQPVPFDAIANVEAPADRVRFGPLEHTPDGGIRFWAIAPILVAGERVGYVAQPRRSLGTRDVLGSAHELMVREEVAVYVHNTDRSVWVSADGTPAAVPSAAEETSRGVWYDRPGNGRVLAEEAAIPGTAWSLVIESPRTGILRRPWPTMRWLLMCCLALTALGIALSWRISRRLTRPLTLLTSASGELAAGRYNTSVAQQGRDEIGQLAAGFDAMAREVVSARRELEHRADESQRRGQELADANDQLRTAMRDIDAARSEAERANSAKGDFLAVMSHELRTPLNAIGGYAELLEMGIHGPVTEAQRDALHRIGRSQAHLLSLINGVLSFARLTAGQISYAIEDVPVHETLAELETLIAPQVRISRVAFEFTGCDATLMARADRDKLRQILVNLLGNAIKYTPSGGTISVACAADEEHVRIAVRDTGVGIPKARLAQIFEPFVQGQRALNRPEEGVGLGLAISRDLAHGMGCELTVESEEGTGSVFTLVLPRAEQPSFAPA